MLKYLYLLLFPLSIIIVRKYDLELKHKFYILLVGFTFCFVPFTNNKPAPDKITINTGSDSFVVLGENMIKKTNIILEPKNADKELLDFVSEDYSVAYIENGNIHSLSEGETFVYVRYKNIVSNKIKVIVNYGVFSDVTDDEGYVFITSSGSKYHASECNVINPKVSKITIDEAKKLGATPCKSCLGE